MNKVRLIFKSISEIVNEQGIALITLVDESGMRQLSISCVREMAHEISMHVGPVPHKEKMLPEVLARLLPEQVRQNLQIVIYDLLEGEYKAYVFNSETFETHAILVADGVLMSVVGNIPLYIEEGLMNRQSTEYRDGATGISVPLNAMSIEMLNHSLQKAIEQEDYEMASKFRDELALRKKQ